MRLYNMFKFLFTSLLIVSFGGCNTNSYMRNLNHLFNEQKVAFGKEMNMSNLLTHFPKKIINKNVFFEAKPPTYSYSHKYRKQFGDIFLAVNKSEYHKEFSALLNEEMSYVSAYTDSNTIINLSELRKDIFPVEKCNKWYQNKLPIPYFESYDFGLGDQETKKKVDGVLCFEYTHVIPSDLQVYVINAEAGDFWKESCNEKRPLALKEWQHGYSKGFAVSEEQNIVIYWVMIW